MNVSIDSIAADTLHEFQVRRLSLRSVTILDGHDAYIQPIPRDGAQYWQLHALDVQTEVVYVGHVDGKQ